VQSEHGETRQVVCSGEEVEVGVDFGSAPHAGFPSAVATTHQVGDFAFDFGTGGPVVGSPFGILLETTGISETVFVTPDTDPATAFGGGALWTQQTADTGVGEGGSPVPVGAPSDGDGHIVGAGDSAGVEIDIETVFGEQGPGWVLHPESMPPLARVSRNSPVPYAASPYTFGLPVPSPSSPPPAPP